MKRTPFNKSKIKCIVYHGTNIDNISSFTKNGDSYFYWFTPDKWYASSNATKRHTNNPTIYSAYINLTNPLNIGNIDKSIIAGRFDPYLMNFARTLGTTTDKLISFAKNPKFIYEITNTKGFADFISDMGYDGVIAEEGLSTSYGVLDDKQIKIIDKEEVKDDMRESIDMMRENALNEAKADIDAFKDKFGEDTYDNFIKAKDRLKNNNISVDITYHTKNTSPQEMDEIIQSVYNRDKDKQKLRKLQGKDKEIRGKYRDFGIHDGYHVFQPLDYISSMDLGVNTGWCTTGRYGHAGKPDFTPSENDAKSHFEDYTSKGVELLYFLNPKTMYGEYAMAIFPYVVDVQMYSKDKTRYVNTSNYIIYNSKDEEDFSNYEELENIAYECGFEDIWSEVDDMVDGILVTGPEGYRGVAYTDPNIEIAEVPYDVVFIESYAFSGRENLKKVILSDDDYLEKIEYSAFSLCPNLHEIVIPESVKEVEKYSLDRIENIAFMGDTEIETLAIDERVSTVYTDSEYVKEQCEDYEIECKPLSEWGNRQKFDESFNEFYSDTYQKAYNYVNSQLTKIIGEFRAGISSKDKTLLKLSDLVDYINDSTRQGDVETTEELVLMGLVKPYLNIIGKY